jgi:hypothetical protein
MARPKPRDNQLKQPASPAVAADRPLAASAVRRSAPRRARLQFTLRTLLLGVAVAAVVLGALRFYFYEIEGVSESYQRASRVRLIQSSLPTGATAINYWAAPGRGLLMANFRIDEESFVAWAAERGWLLDEIDSAGGARCVPRIYQRIPGAPAPTRSAVLREGYVYREESEEQQGQFLVVAYDRNDQRGYFTRFKQ